MSDISAGRYKAIVVSTVIEQDPKGQTYILATFGVEDETHTKRIYLTEKAMGIARAQLKAMGFDSDAQSLKELDTNPLLLANNEVELEFAPWESNEGTILQIKAIYAKRQPKTDGFIAGLDRALREVKKSDGSKPAKKKAAATKPTEEDSIPF